MPLSNIRRISDSHLSSAIADRREDITWHTHLFISILEQVWDADTSRDGARVSRSGTTTPPICFGSCDHSQDHLHKHRTYRSRHVTLSVSFLLENIRRLTDRASHRILFRVCARRRQLYVVGAPQRGVEAQTSLFAWPLTHQRRVCNVLIRFPVVAFWPVERVSREPPAQSP
ncbi:hypothetical protein BD309DRAFT_654160 [Dichomitus squalens]|nr:hypothetical protein BD309DRAFT_654160 [Dichomitus squalens]